MGKYMIINKAGRPVVTDGVPTWMKILFLFATAVAILGFLASILLTHLLYGPPEL